MSVVVMLPDNATRATAEAVQRQLDIRRANGGGDIILSPGTRLGVIGGMGIIVRLSGGPLDNVRLSLQLDALDDLPDRLSLGDLWYEPSTTSDGAYWTGTTGELVYAWRAAP